MLFFLDYRQLDQLIKVFFTEHGFSRGLLTDFKIKVYIASKTWDSRRKEIEHSMPQISEDLWPLLTVWERLLCETRSNKTMGLRTFTGVNTPNQPIGGQVDPVSGPEPLNRAGCKQLWNSCAFLPWQWWTVRENLAKWHWEIYSKD